jgi:anti-sigma factor RsiW
MSSTPPDMPSEEQINAYLDGELTAPEVAMVECAAQADPALRERLDLDASINDGLQELFDSALLEPIPARLVNAAGPRPWSRWQRFGAAAACICLGILIGWSLRTSPDADHLVSAARPVGVEAAAAHAVFTRENRHSVEVREDDSEHLNRWLSKRLAHDFVAPDLREHGLKLIGGRLHADSGRPAALYMYEREDGERVTIYVRAQAKPAKAEGINTAQDRGFKVVHWADQDLAYAVTGKIELGKLQRVANFVQERY